MIQKELLSKVLSINADNSRGEYQIIGNFLYYEEAGDIPNRINIHELVYKCKEWIVVQGYYVSIFIGDYFCKIKISEGISFIGKIELEAVIKACEWILKETND